MVHRPPLSLRALFIRAGISLACLCALPTQAQGTLGGRTDSRWQALESGLASLATGNRSATPVRILQLGDSHTAGGHFSHRLQQRFQSHFGTGIGGLLPPGQAGPGGPIDIQIAQSPRWSTTQVRGKDARNTYTLGLGGFVGAGNAPFQTVSYNFPEKAQLSRLFVYSESLDPGNRPFRLYQGEQERLPNYARGHSPSTTRSVFELQGTSDRLTLLVRNDASSARLLGLVALSSKPGVTFSALGLNGARFGILDEWDSKITRAQLHDYNPHLLILAFGTNDVVNTRYVPAEFRASLENTAAWIAKHVPRAAVLLVMPPHAPQHGMETAANLRSARSLMERLAEEKGWRTWDWSSTTGSRCNPACLTRNGDTMFQADGIHLTHKGYEESADVLFEAMLSGIRMRATP